MDEAPCDSVAHFYERIIALNMQSMGGDGPTGSGRRFNN